MSETDYDYESAWPMYSNEDEPWKNLERLLKLEEKMETQQEMGDALGCTPSTISYWLDKARDEVEIEPDEEELHCDYFEVCGNLTPGVNNGNCTVCLDLVRHNQSQVSGMIDPDDFENRLEHLEALYEEYDSYAEDRQADYDSFHSEDSKTES